MVTFPLNLPASVKISSSTFGLNFHQTGFASEISGIKGIAEFNLGKTDRWEGSLTICKQPLSNAGDFFAFLVSLRAGQGTFLAFDPDRQHPSTLNGSFPGTGLVNGAGQTGRSLVTNGWPASELILKTGDLVQAGGQLLEVSGDITTNGSGAATLTFQPALRTSPANGAQILTSNPVMVARLKERDLFLETLPTHSEEITIFFEEVI